MTDKINRAKAALALTFVGDSLSMPVHWFYRQGDILKCFPPSGITTFQPAPESHPSSIMSLHSTGRGGRGSQQQEEAVVGRVILQGKAAYWNQRNMHYHHGMPAGENTLNTWCARWLMNWLVDQDLNTLSVTSWLERYVERMTAANATHPDTYAESYHREFFANYQRGMPLPECGGKTHDTPSMGGLVTVAPLALALLSEKSLEETQSVCREFVYATHPDAMLMHVVDAYVYVIDQLVNQQASDPASLFVEAASVVPNGSIGRLLHKRQNIDAPILKLVSEDTAVIGRQYSPACYITDSWPGVCYLAARYFQSPHTGLLVNTNLGGENAHRGSVLGVLTGLASADTTHFYQKLHRYPEISADITRWCERFYPTDVQRDG